MTEQSERRASEDQKGNPLAKSIKSPARFGKSASSSEARVMPLGARAIRRLAGGELRVRAPVLQRPHSNPSYPPPTSTQHVYNIPYSLHLYNETRRLFLQHVKKKVGYDQLDTMVMMRNSQLDHGHCWIYACFLATIYFTLLLIYVI